MIRIPSFAWSYNIFWYLRLGDKDVFFVCDEWYHVKKNSITTDSVVWLCITHVLKNKRYNFWYYCQIWWKAQALAPWNLEVASNTTFWGVGCVIGSSCKILDSSLYSVHPSFKFHLNLKRKRLQTTPHPGLRRLNFPLISKKGRKGKSLALLQIWHLILGCLLGLIDLDKYTPL